MSDSFKVCLIALAFASLPLIGAITYFPLFLNHKMVQSTQSLFSVTLAIVFCEVVAALCLLLGFEWSIQEFYQEQYRKRKRVELKEGIAKLEPS